MAPPVSSDRLEISNDPILIRYLEQLEISVEQQGGEDRGWILSREACEKAGVPFQFFQRFARLDSSSSNPLFRKDSARTLLGCGDELSQGSSDAFGFLDRAFEQSVEPLLFQDNEINPDEELVLRGALEALDHWAPDYSFLRTIESPTLLYPERTRGLISEVAASRCWLSEEALRVGLLGVVNGWRVHHLHDEIREGERVQRSTMAVETPCDYLPSLHHVMKGLFYRLDQLPETVQRAAQSTVMIETERGTGSGVVVDRNYILTNRHELSRLFGPNDPQRFHFPKTQGTIRFLNKGEPRQLSGSFEVVSFPAFSDEFESHPFTELKPVDLVLLYVPSLPKNVLPLPFSSDFLGEEFAGNFPLDGVDSNTPVRIKPMHEGLMDIGYVIPLSPSARVYGPDPLFVIGYPVQEGGPDLLVSTGRVYENLFAMMDDQGLLRTTAVALPGNSGGPVVDIEGRLVGILTAADFDQKDQASESAQQGTLDAPIAGSRMYPIDLIGGTVRWLIKAHRTKKWPKGREFICEDEKPGWVMPTCEFVEEGSSGGGLSQSESVKPEVDMSGPYSFLY